MRALAVAERLLALWLLGGCALVPGVVRRPVERLIPPRDAFHEIRFLDGSGVAQRILARVCRPGGDGPSPVAVLNHGGPRPGADRAAMTAPGCDTAPARWFLARGYLVVLPLRRGNGATGGEWAQNPGACASPDYVRAGLEGGRDIDAAVKYATALPYARPDGVVVAGEDEGGWAVMGYAARPNPAVVALVNVAGGMGGLAGRQERRTCRPDLLVDAAGEFGRTARNPMLWIYAADDDVFSPELATAMQSAFVDAGGSADLVRPTEVGRDAHTLLFSDAGARIWGGLVAPLIARSGR